jgi:hypothetical protein
LAGLGLENGLRTGGDGFPILCDILTGKPPYVGRSSEEVRRKACNGDLADVAAPSAASYVVTSLLANMGVPTSTPLLERFREPASATAAG